MSFTMYHIPTIKPQSWQFEAQRLKLKLEHNLITTPATIYSSAFQNGPGGSEWANKRGCEDCDKKGQAPVTYLFVSALTTSPGNGAYSTVIRLHYCSAAYVVNHFCQPPQGNNSAARGHKQLLP